MITVGGLVAVAAIAGFLMRSSGPGNSSGKPLNTASAIKSGTRPPAKPATGGSNRGSGKVSRPSTANSVASAGTQAGAAKAKPGQLKAQLRTYIADFERYHAARLELNEETKAKRLAVFRERLGNLLDEASQTEASDPSLLSDVYRELGTLEWYRARPRKARANWQEALSINPKNELASAWLRETEGAVLKE
jgi:hypothetical protein